MIKKQVFELQILFQGSKIELFAQLAFLDQTLQIPQSKSFNIFYPKIIFQQNLWTSRNNFKNLPLPAFFPPNYFLSYNQFSRFFHLNVSIMDGMSQGLGLEGPKPKNLDLPKRCKTQFDPGLVWEGYVMLFTRLQWLKTLLKWLKTLL